MTPSADHYRGALLGLALGDALGAPYEFKSPPFEVGREFRTGVFGTAPGHPTDDSTLACFAAEAVLDDGEDWPAGYGRRLAAWAASGPPDIGNQTARAARCWADGAGPAADEQAQGNGSLMAVTPVILRFAADRDTARAQAGEFALLTHPSRGAYDTNLRFADAVLDALDGGTPPGIEGLAAVPDSQQMGWCRLCYDLALVTLAAAEEKGPFEALVNTIALGGDTDTNAAVAGALLGARYGTDAWPADLVEQLHLGPRMVELADRLWAAADLG